MVLSMSEVVFEMIALGLEDIMIFVLGLPPTSACTSDLGHGFGGQVMVSYPSIGVEDFAIGFSHQRQFTPVDEQGGLSVAQWELIDIAIAVNFFRALVLLCLFQGLDFTIRFQVVQPVIESRMRLW